MIHDTTRNLLRESKTVKLPKGGHAMENSLEEHIKPNLVLQHISAAEAMVRYAISLVKKVSHDLRVLFDNRERSLPLINSSARLSIFEPINQNR